MHKPSIRRQAGVTLVEMTAVLGITSVLLGSALPDLSRMRANQSLHQAVAPLRTDVQFARASAVALGQTVRLATATDTGGSCYVIHAGPSGSCQCAGAAATCSAQGRLLHAAHLGTSHPVTVSANVSNMIFDGKLGTVTPTGTLTLAAAGGQQLKVVVNVMGRAHTCRAAGSISGYPAC